RGYRVCSSFRVHGTRHILVKMRALYARTPGRLFMQDGGVIFFDLTQLVLRVVDPTPDGIGRVELAYARHLLAHYPRKVRFLFALPRLVQVIPTSVAARYIKAI